MATYAEIKQTRKLLDSSILRMPGTVAVATGYKKKDGERTDELAIIIYVQKKISEKKMPFFHTIPSSVEIRGIRVPTDIVEVGYYVPYSYTSNMRPAKGGVSIGHLNITAGTLGGLVCDQDGKLLIISNNHVLADMNNASIGDTIIQRGVHDGGSSPADDIAQLEKFVPLDFTAGSINYVDCAVAKPFSSSDVSFEILDIGFPNLTETYNLTLQDVENQLQVQKTGRTTEHTIGRVGAIDWKGTVLYNWKPVYFENQVLVESIDGSPVAEGGDSGSLVLTCDESPKICGLLFAGPTSGEHYIANHIGEVFNRLDLKLCCATADTVRGSKAEEFLPDLRRFRDKLRRSRELIKFSGIYGRNSGKILEILHDKPELDDITRDILSDVGSALRNPRQKIEKATVENGLKLIETMVNIRKRDKRFAEDMGVVAEILKESSGKTVSEILQKLGQ